MSSHPRVARRHPSVRLAPPLKNPASSCFLSARLSREQAGQPLGALGALAGPTRTGPGQGGRHRGACPSRASASASRPSEFSN